MTSILEKGGGTLRGNQASSLRKSLATYRRGDCYRAGRIRTLVIKHYTPQQWLSTSMVYRHCKNILEEQHHVECLLITGWPSG